MEYWRLCALYFPILNNKYKSLNHFIRSHICWILNETCAQHYTYTDPLDVQSWFCEKKALMQKIDLTWTCSLLVMYKQAMAATSIASAAASAASISTDHSEYARYSRHDLINWYDDEKRQMIIKFFFQHFHSCTCTLCTLFSFLGFKCDEILLAYRFQFH